MVSLTAVGHSASLFFFFFFTLVTGPRRSLSLKLSDTQGGKYHPPRGYAARITHLKAQGPSRTCIESNNVEEEDTANVDTGGAPSPTPPCRQPRGKWMVSLVNSHTNATWHLWVIDLRFALNSTPGWRGGHLGTAFSLISIIQSLLYPLLYL